MSKIVEISHLFVRHGSQTTLEDVNLEIFDNDFVGIIGPNGGGKSTLVKSIVGLQSYEGTITLAPELEDGRRIGYMPQTNNFDKQFPISVEELILSGLQSEKGLNKRYCKADKARAAALAEEVGISHLLGRTIGGLSGGELQRALLCRAIINFPRLLILDEPANFVDNRFERELYEILERLSKNMAILVVSHDVGTITSVVRSIVCVNRTVHRHATAELTAELLENYHCPIQVVFHDDIPHTVLPRHDHSHHPHDSHNHSH